jgi:hypothetical protein
MYVNGVELMTNIEKIEKLERLMALNTANEYLYYDCLQEIGELKGNYYNYLTTSPMDPELELKRIAEADYNLCAALITMLLREDHFSNGQFVSRYQQGVVTSIIQRMVSLLKTT